MNYSIQKIIVDNTTSYARDPLAPKRIYNYNPKSKIVFLIRNPIDRAFSHYWHEKRKLKINFKFEENLQFKIIFDTSQVTALDDDMDKKYQRGNLGVAGGFMEVAEARELVGLDVRDGEHTEDLKEPPRITKDFLTGETYIHFFKFEEPGGVDGAIFTVGLVGAATEVDGTLYGKLKNIADDIQNNIKKKNKKLDVLILCVPGWDNIDGHEYPKNLIDILRPRIILLTHYDNFFDANRNVDPVRLVPSAKFNEFLNKLQKDIDGIPGYDEFESILIPGVGTTLYLNKPPSGVINVSRLSR